MADAVERLKAALADRYRIERELGAGGMATVYLAEDLKHHRKVAVKVLRADLAASLGVERFLREVGIAARLTHPHILGLHDSGEADGFLYYVMPYVEGVSLREKLQQEGPLPIPEAVRYLRDVADAMAYAHQQGVVHRDIKPENVMLDGRHALVMDFGVAKALALGQGAEATTLTGTGLALGTPAYMAPEQAAGEARVDHRADLYAWGVMAYELLTGQPPFVRETPQAVMAAHISGTPELVTARRAGIGPALSDLVMHCLEKDPAARFQSASDLLAGLDSLSTPGGGAAAVSRSPLPRRIGVTVAAAVITSGAVYGGVTIQRERWVRAVSPLIQHLFEAGQTDSAYTLATRALAKHPNDLTLRALWTRNTSPWRFCTEPAGATVLRASFGDTTSWQHIATTPTDIVRLPVASRIRFVKPGYRHRDLLATTHPHFIGGPTESPYPDPKFGTSGVNWCGPATVRLEQFDSPDSTLIHVPDGLHYLDFKNLAVAYGVFADTSWVTVRGFRIGRHEVTNHEYQAFVRAGGYRSREYWEHPFVRGGKAMSWEAGIELLVDRSGQPGPATWEGGTPVPGTESLPVGGLSWYEAAAYARFAGRSLPTIYHWAAAAGIDTYTLAYAVQGSNMESAGPRPPSNSGGMSLTGAFDMAGNVREWVANADQDGRRYILGGGWSDPTFVFVNAMALAPFDRSPMNGVRLAALPADDPTLARAARTITAPSVYGRSREPPVPESVYRDFLRLYDYDPAPLRAEVVSRDSTSEDWVVERVLVDAAYGGERLPVVLFLPKGPPGPFQTVVYFPGSYALASVSSAAMSTYDVSFLIHSGRAVAWPVYKSTFERGDDLKDAWANESVRYRDHVVMWAKDLRRTVDYLTTRPDIDGGKLAYFGFSWGAMLGPVMLAVEPRLRAGIFYVGGLAPRGGRPEVDVFNYLPRVTAPILMINGREDPYFPIEGSQQPMFQGLGTAPDRKRAVAVPGGHFAPRAVLISETRNWLDRYLGPVR